MEFPSIDLNDIFSYDEAAADVLVQPLEQPPSAAAAAAADPQHETHEVVWQIKPADVTPVQDRVSQVL